MKIERKQEYGNYIIIMKQFSSSKIKYKITNYPLVSQPCIVVLTLFHSSDL